MVTVIVIAPNVVYTHLTYLTPLPKHNKKSTLLTLYLDLSCLESYKNLQPRTVGFDIHAQDPSHYYPIFKISQKLLPGRSPLKRVPAIRIQLQLQEIGASAPDFRIL